MGCHKYTVSGHVDGGEWAEGTIHFSESDDSVTCLCTTHIDGRGRLDLEEIRSLAYLGAAVIFQHQRHQEWWHLPGDLPQWVRDEIDRVVLFHSRDAAPSEEKP